MKVFKIILVFLWLLSTTLFVVGALTPLEFRSEIMAYVTFFIAFNGMFSLRFLLTDFIRLKFDRVIIAFLISLILTFTYAFLPIHQYWKTQEILYRQMGSENNVIAFQMESGSNSKAGHRIVKMIRITLFFDWVIELNRVQVGSDWVKVNEYINEKGIE